MSSQNSYLSDDTIAALITPTGGAVAILRVSGALCFNIHAKMLGLAPSTTPRDVPIWKSKPRRLNLGFLVNQYSEPLDQVLWVSFPGPDSYTGEDVVEYQIHGSAWIAQRLLEVLFHHGARQALPGEFSFRAVRNGKMSLFQAQAVADLIGARNDSAVSIALDKLSGSHSHLISKLSQDLREIAALGEVGIDFADQDVEEVSLPALKARLRPSIETLERLHASFERGKLFQEGITVALVGLPNAGKSSFFNALLGEDRSIVSEIAGTTRDIIREQLTLQGEKTTLTLRLEDTAGLRATSDPIEKSGIERASQAAQKADLILWIIDPSTPTDSLPEHWGMIQGAAATSALSRTIPILTKIDQASPYSVDQITSILQSLGHERVIRVSSISGEGISSAAQTIAQDCEKSLARKPGELILTRLEHAQAARESLAHLNRAMGVFEVDLFASDLRQGLNALAPLIGETLPDDILGKIFSNFCIGK